MNDTRSARPLRTLMEQTVDERRVEAVHRRLRASRDRFTSRWRWHLAAAACTLGVWCWPHLFSPSANAVTEKECVVIIRPGLPSQVIGESC
jgi:hypothetical protein